MTDAADILDRIDVATDRLLGTVRRLTDDDVRRTSLLPGWTVGHVLTHIARNADSLVNLATWARTGVPTPQYVSQESRDADVEAGSTRDAATLYDDVASTADRLRDTLRALPPEAWDVVVEWRSGRRRPASAIPDARLTEVEVHHADLGLDYGFGDIPRDLRLGLIADAVGDWDGVAVRIDDAQSGEDPEGPIVVSGSSGDLLGWVSGRTSGERLRCAGPLPAVPEWR
jgi:maleylpyruvate isomerase